MGEFSSSYDLISSEYGWTNDQIDELPFARFQQIVSAIRVRKYFQQREENARFSWLGRSLASFIAAGYMTDGDNPALDHAGKLAMDDVEATLLGNMDVAGGEWKPGDPAILKKEPTMGSFEKLMGTMSQTRG